MKMRINKCHKIKILLIKHSHCNQDRKKTLVKHMINIYFNIAGNNLQKYLNR